MDFTLHCLSAVISREHAEPGRRRGGPLSVAEASPLPAVRDSQWQAETHHPTSVSQ